MIYISLFLVVLLVVFAPSYALSNSNHFVQLLLKNCATTLHKKYISSLLSYLTISLTHFLKISPLSAKFLNISKLALAGENRTTSPFIVSLFAF